MKKQLLIAAVAATMGTAAMAELSIGGDAKFEYFNIDNANVVTNKVNTETNLNFKGKSGDTTVVLNMEFNTSGATSVTNTDTDTTITALDSTTGDISGAVVNPNTSTANDTVNIEDMYIQTKVGDITVKAGNYTTSTSAILGEIENGSRSNNKVTLSTTLNGVKVYAGNIAASGSGATAIDANMFAGVSATVAGFKVEAKHNSPTTDSFAISGDVAGVGVRLEQLNSDVALSDVTFGNITKEVNGVSLGYAWIDADADSLIAEDDSAIFAVENDGNGDSNSQMSAKMALAGNTVTVKSGTVGYASGTDLDYTQFSLVRPLASGSTLAVLYTDAEQSATTTKETLEVELSVKF